jgi:hypothetical protein
MKDRWGLIQRGLFPETLPPCFTSIDLRRAFSGLVKDLKSKELHQKRQTDYVRYSGTKHDGNRRYFGTPNPISYFYVASFIADNWGIFDKRFKNSPFSVSQPRIGKETDDRPIIIPSLSELTTVASKKLGRAAFILKTDISQFFPSIYTHSIPWSAYGIEIAKSDQDLNSKTAIFNRLDFHVRNCQRAETRGVLVGPDAFRLISEFIAAGLDAEIFSEIKDYTVGAARHVDDYYIGLRGQPEALAALSVLREVLQRYSLQINDSKTRTMSGVEPLNEVWAQDLRKDSRKITRIYSNTDEDVVLFISKALTVAREVQSDSPVKIALRTLDQTRVYEKSLWGVIEPYLQRIVFHHPHCIDYVALLVVKRSALDRGIDRDGWKAVCYDLIDRHLPLNHHHEVVWLTWLLVSVRLEISDKLSDALSANANAHIRSMLVAAYVDKRIDRKPPIKLGGKLATTDDSWLLNLVSKSTGYTNANFSGVLSSEFQHLSDKKVKLIDFDAHIKSMKKSRIQAISRTRYGYDSDNHPENGEDDDDGDFWNRI